MLVLVYYVIFYEQSSLSGGEAWRPSFQDHTDKLIASKKNKYYGIKGNNIQLRLSFCDVYHINLFKRQR